MVVGLGWCVLRGWLLVVVVGLLVVVVGVCCGDGGPVCGRKCRRQ